MVYCESREVNLDEEWISRLHDTSYYLKHMVNWGEVKSLPSHDRTLSKLVFGLVRPYGFTEVKAEFSDMWRINYRANKESNRFHLEINISYRSLMTSDLLKFVRYVVYETLGIRYVPDVRCFKDWVCPKPLMKKLPSNIYCGTRTEEGQNEAEAIHWVPEGKRRNLLDSVQRLLNMGLITREDISESYFCWSNEVISSRLGWCNPYSGVVVINSAYDGKDVPYQVVDLLVYHECLHLRQRFLEKRFGPDEDPHDAQFREWECMYPQFEIFNREMGRIAYRSLSG